MNNTEDLLCPRFEKATQILGKRWTVLIVNQLMNGPQRFCKIESAFPISGRILSERLKDLEQQGIVKREVFAETPVRIEYSLTEKGNALTPAVREIQKWSQDWIEMKSKEE